MVKNLVNKSQFAEMAGVSAAAVTKACKSTLARALVGKRIDLDHEDAVKYLARHDPVETPTMAAGLDPLHEKALQHCQETGKYSISELQRALRIGWDRASSIMGVMKATGKVPDKPTHTSPIKHEKPQDRPKPAGRPPPPPAPPPRTSTTPPDARVVSGKERVRETKKSVAQQRLAAAFQAGDDEFEDGDIIHEVPEDIEAFADMTLRELIRRFGTDVAFLDWLKATKEIEAINEKRLKNAQTKGSLVSRALVQNGVIDVFNSAHLRLLKDGAKSIAAGAISKHASGAEPAAIEAYVSDILGSFIKPVKNKISRALKDA